MNAADAIRELEELRDLPTLAHERDPWGLGIATRSRRRQEAVDYAIRVIKESDSRAGVVEGTHE